MEIGLFGADQQGLGDLGRQLFKDILDPVNFPFEISHPRL
jgi:hypothetical protein